MFKVLVVDTEFDYSEITSLFFKNLEKQTNFQGTLLIAPTIQFAMSLVQENPDISIILLDLRVENKESGIQFCKWFRNNSGNKTTQVILRLIQLESLNVGELIKQNIITASINKDARNYSEIEKLIARSVERYENDIKEESQKKGNKSTIMIYEDEENVAQMLNMLFTHEPKFYTLPHFSSTNNCLEQVEIYRPDIIIMDLFFKKRFSGLKAINDIKRKYPSQKILVLSGYYTTSLIIASIKAGARGFHRKPFETRSLIRSCKDILCGNFAFDEKTGQQYIQYMNKF